MARASKRFKISIKLIILLLLLITFTGLSLGAVLFKNFHVMTKNTICSNLQSIADNGAMIINEKILSTKKALEILSRTPELVDPNLHPREKSRYY